jgi:hypothetical protein
MLTPDTFMMLPAVPDIIIDDPSDWDGAVAILEASPSLTISHDALDLNERPITREQKANHALDRSARRAKRLKKNNE